MNSFAERACKKSVLLVQLYVEGGFFHLFFVRRKILDMHQACQGADMARVEGAAECVPRVPRSPGRQAAW